MRSVIVVVILALFMRCTPALLAQGDHIEIGAFADYFNLSRTTPNINYVGLGGRVGFNVRPTVQIEAELSYAFERNFTSVFSDWHQHPVCTKPHSTNHGAVRPEVHDQRRTVPGFWNVQSRLRSFADDEMNPRRVPWQCPLVPTIMHGKCLVPGNGRTQEDS